MGFPGLGFRGLRGLGFLCLGFWGLGFRNSGFGVQEFRVWGSGVQGLGFRSSGFGAAKGSNNSQRVRVRCLQKVEIAQSASKELWCRGERRSKRSSPASGGMTSWPEHLFSKR